MSSITTPARARWARSNTTGDLETALAPGAMAINWPDRKIYAGGTNGQPLLFSQLLMEHSKGLHYYPGDIAISEGQILRCIAEAPVGTDPVNPYWEIIGGSSGGGLYEALLTSVLSGGALSIVGPDRVQISTGRGIVVDNTEVLIQLVYDVEWPTQQLQLIDLDEQVSIIGVDRNGNVVSTALDDVEFEVWRRDNILLGAAIWDGAQIGSVIDLTIPAGGTAENFRDMYFSSGGPYRARGLRPRAVTGTFNLAVAEGQVFDMGGRWRTASRNPNIHDVPEIPQLTFAVTLRDRVAIPSTSIVDRFSYDVNGVATAVPAENWTIQYLTAVPDFSEIYVQYGQTLYPSAFAAAEAIPSDWEGYVRYADTEVTVLVGAIIVGPDDASLGAARVINAMNEPAPFAAAIATETGDFLLLDGTRAMTGGLNMGEQDINNAGTVYATGVSGAEIKSRSIVWS